MIPTGITSGEERSETRKKKKKMSPDGLLSEVSRKVTGSHMGDLQTV